MDGSEKKKTVRKKSSKNRKLLTIIVLLLLCVVTAAYILTHYGRRGDDVPAEPAEEIPAAEESGEADEEAANAAAEKAASHVYSHRGSAGDDELTIAAYDRAIEAGSRFIEADIVVSASGTVYLAHDDHALEMTGYDGFFSGMTDGQIDELSTRSGNKVVKLKDLFDKYGDSVTYLVDIKYSSQRNIEAFTEIVKKYGCEDNVIATSSYFDALRPLEETFPDMTKLYVCADPATFDLALTHDYIDIISVPKDLMAADNLKAAHDSGKKFSAWTLNSEAEIKKAIELGVDSYFTDDSALAIELEKELRTD